MPMMPTSTPARNASRFTLDMISDILSSALDGVFLDHNFYVQKRTANCVWDKHQHRLYTRLSPNSSMTAGVSGHRDGKDAVVRASIRVLLSPLIRFVSPTMSPYQSTLR